MKIGDNVSYTFIDKRIFASADDVYEKFNTYTIEGMVIAYDDEYVYIKTMYGNLKRLKSLVQVKKPQSKRKRL
jgi:hypothetical protein